MKKTNLILLILCCACITGFSQNYYGETLPRQMACNCREKMQFGMNQGSISSRPFYKSGDCPYHFVPVPVPVSYTSNGFYFFKRQKRRTHVSYPNKSHIIRF